MAERPSLKLKLSMAKAPKNEPQNSPPLPPPSASTPSATPSLKLKFGKKSVSQTPAPQQADTANQAPGTTKPKPARKPKPTPKKRALEEDPLTSDDDEEPLASRSVPGPAVKKQKFRLSVGGSRAQAPLPSATGSKPKLLRLKGKGQLPERPKGVGYDSEADDLEKDPTLTEALILRMAPGDDCEYLRAAVASGNFGKSKDGGADVRFRFLRSDGRRACVTIRGNHYAAILVDLPCIVEAMKSWFPKTGWIKSADVCQMLMVLGRIEDEEEAKEYPPPLSVRGEFDEKTWQWAHGLTPPMHWVRKRRFRKRISVETVKEVEAEVEEMLRLDAACVGKPLIEDIYERPNRGSDMDSDDEDGFDGEEDAEGDLVDEQDMMPLDTIENEDEDDEAEHARMAAEFEQQLMEAGAGGDDDPEIPPLTSTAPLFESPTPATALNDFASPPPSLTTTPSAALAPASSAADNDDDDDDDDEQESSEEDLDEDQLERKQELQKLREDVRDLDDVIRAEQAKLAATGNQLLRKRIGDKIRGYQQDRELKLAAAGEGGVE